MAVPRKKGIAGVLDGEMRVHRVTGPIVGGVAVALVLLMIVLVF